ncbi:MAG: thiamine-phosphate kinase [candidate division WOR-3 bacterium]
MLVSKLGEAGLIELIRKTVRNRGRLKVGIGDDACVLNDGTVLTTDAYAEGVHFDLSYMNMKQVGERCACAALSDVVAMGAEPEVLLVALSVRRDVRDSDVRALYSGIESVCRELGCEVGGGDIIASDRLLLALTAVGRARRPLQRSAARPGDFVYMTGFAGLAETGRLALKLRLKSKGFATAIRRHLRPLPRLELVRKVRPKVHALIDTSDGLATDAAHIAEMSRVKVELDLDAIPVAPATRRLCRERHLDLTQFVLTSGEDYELLLTSPVRLPGLVGGTMLTCIGRVKRGEGLYAISSGVARRIQERGYDHLA